MRAVIVASCGDSRTDAAAAVRPNCLLPLVDRPFLQHLIELLVDQNLTEFDFVLGAGGELIQTFLGDGTRFDSRFRYHAAPNPQLPYDCLRAIAGGGSDVPILLLDADVLPGKSVESLFHADPGDRPLSLNEVGDRGRWSGWAVLNRASVAEVPAYVTHAGMEAHLRAAGDTIETAEVLSARTSLDLLVSQGRVLTDGFGGWLPIEGQEQDGIRMMRGARVHPSARVRGPVFIGENAQIGADVVLGPNVVIGANSVIDKETTACHSLVCPNSYAGVGLEMDQVILDGPRLTHAQLDTTIDIKERFLVSAIQPRTARSWLTSIRPRG